MVQHAQLHRLAFDGECKTGERLPPCGQGVFAGKRHLQQAGPLDLIMPGGNLHPGRLPISGKEPGHWFDRLNKASGAIRRVASDHSRQRFVDFFVVLVAAFSWALGTLLARHGGMHASPLVTSGQQMISGGTALLLISALQREPLPTGAAGVSTPSLVAFAYLTIFGSMVAFSAYVWLTKVSTPARLSTITYVNLLVAVVLGWVFLGESLTLQSLWGAGLIVVAVVAMTAPMPRFLTTAVRAKPAKAR